MRGGEGGLCMRLWVFVGFLDFGEAAADYVRAVGCVRLRDCSLVMLLLGLRCIERGEGGRSSLIQ